jgi:hypothetical protein
VLWCGPVANDRAPLYLMFHEDHVDLLTTPAPFLARDGFCLKCLKGYDGLHMSCHATCQGCLKASCPEMNSLVAIYCNECCRYFKGPQYFASHLIVNGRSGRTLCTRVRKCPQCKRLLSKSNKTLLPDGTHVCGERFCTNCKQFVLRSHLCYIKSDRVEVEGDTAEEEEGAVVGVTDEIRDPAPIDEEIFHSSRYMYFDIETYPHEQTAEHICSLIVCQDNVTEQEYVFEGADCMGEFGRWVMRRQMRRTTFVAHNSARYDSHFMLRWAVTQTRQQVKIIAIGGKLLMVLFPAFEVRFVDSYNFLQAALARLPGMFGLADEVRKGFFPHRFSSAETLEYRGPIPDVHYFDRESMKAARAAEFDEWYAEQQNNEYDYKRELYLYCSNDTLVLRKCCEIFRRLFFEKTLVDPFSRLTLASACHAVFRKHFLRPNSIAIVPSDGYAGHDNQSFEAMEFLRWREHEGRRIRHAWNGEEHVVVSGCRRYKLDGVLLNDDGVIDQRLIAFEYLGCWYHGCKECYNDNVWNSLSKKRMGSLYQDHLSRQRALDNAGWNVEWMWGCDWKREKDANPDIAQFLIDNRIRPPIKPRSAFYGGRTNATRLYHVAQEGERIRYADINSLYP